MEASSSYPQREPFFSHRFCRLLADTAAAQEIGPETCWLLTIIVMTEDARHYTSPVTFYNGQLAQQCGFNSENRLDRHRKRAVASGWLHYETGGKRRPGIYWVTTPAAFATTDTQAQNDVTPDLHLQNGGTNVGNAEGEVGVKRRPSYHDSIPNPNTQSNHGATRDQRREEPRTGQPQAIAHLIDTTIGQTHRPPSTQTVKRKWVGHVQPHDLLDVSHLQILARRAASVGIIEPGREGLLVVLAAAHHVRKMPDVKNIGALFISIVEGKSRFRLTPSDFDHARRTLRDLAMPTATAGAAT